MSYDPISTMSFNFQLEELKPEGLFHLLPTGHVLLVSKSALGISSTLLQAN